MRSRDNFIMKEIRVDTMKRNVETLDHLTVQLQEAMKELQVRIFTLNKVTMIQCTRTLEIVNSSINRHTISQRAGISDPGLG